MKKISFFLAGASLSVMAFSGCALNYDFTAMSYASGGDVIEHISVDVRDRDVRIEVSNDNQVHIDYFNSDEEYLRISRSGTKLTAQLQYDKNWTDYIGTKKSSSDDRKITIRIPNNTIYSLSVNTTNENITVNSAHVLDSMSLDSNGGDVVCNSAGAEKSISLTSKNGDIRGTIAGSKADFAISCTIKKGKSNLEDTSDGTKTLSVDCNNGDIELSFES